MEKSLSEVKVGDICVVKFVSGEGRYRRRLLDMGLTPGIEIYIRKVAPLGDPIEITLRGYELTLRRDECKLIKVEVK